ncbi:hypothetical protein D3C87_1801870 [compost metagenome]
MTRETRDPWPDGDIGYRKITGDEFPTRQPVVQCPVEALHIRGETRLGKGCLSGIVGQEIMGITECGAKIGALPHQPFGDGQPRSSGGRQKPPDFLGEIDQDRVRFRHNGAIVAIGDRRDFRAGIDAAIIG